jgi:hypothetical protein
MLYSTTVSRPHPTTTTPARFLFAVAGCVTAVVYFSVILYLRSAWSWRIGDIGDTGMVLVGHPPVLVLALIALPAALVPGLGFAWLARRFGKVRRLRCWNCKWSQSFPVNAVWSSEAAQPAQAQFTPAQSDSPFDQIVNDADPWKECTDWAYAEIRRGRVPEDVEKELISQGWPKDDVEIMVEKCRREARYAPAAVSAVRKAGERR